MDAETRAETLKSSFLRKRVNWPVESAVNTECFLLGEARRGINTMKISNVERHIPLHYLCEVWNAVASVNEFSMSLVALSVSFNVAPCYHNVVLSQIWLVWLGHNHVPSIMFLYNCILCKLCLCTVCLLYAYSILVRSEDELVNTPQQHEREVTEYSIHSSQKSTAEGLCRWLHIVEYILLLPSRSLHFSLSVGPVSRDSWAESLW